MPTLAEALMQYGYDPNITDRPAVLPDYRPGVGFVAPEMAVGLAKALMLPGHAMKGGEYTYQDAAEAALNIGGVGGGVGMGAAPAGALAMGAAKKASKSLPMDEASRMARADEMFPIDAYHGRGGDYIAFDRAYLGSNTGADDSLKGFWFAQSPKAASDFAFDHDLPNVMPVRLHMKNPYILTQSRLSKNFNGDMSSAIEHAYKKSHDGVIVRNGEGDGANYVVFDPANIRSRFANFDPSRSNEADLLASNVSPFLSGFSLYGNEE
jgi:hypothetical protein